MNLDNPQELKELLHGCLKGKRRYQKILHESLYPKLLVVCMRYASSKVEAEDFLHQGFIKLFEKLGKYNYKGSFEGWARRIVVNNTIDILRHKREYTVDYEILTIDDGKDEERAEEIESQFNKDRLKAKMVIEAIQQLTPVYRTVFNMRVLDGMSHAQIAETLGVKITTSKSNYQKAKARLIKILKREHPDLFNA